MSELSFPTLADPALLRPRADVCYWMWQLVRALGNVRCWEYAASEGSPGAVLVTTFMQVDCRASTRQRAWSMGDQARRRLKATPWDDWDGGVICDVTCLEGPRWQPDENGAPCYVARYAVTHHPRQGEVAGA